jgi:predicted ATP-dependent endonuclease of OLD family
MWLKNLIKKHGLAFDFEKIYELAEAYRNDNSARKPLKLILLVEGATEEALLPLFSSIAGIDFDKTGIELIASGGKNQVARIYAEINHEVNLPIFIILDADAQEIADEIKKHIRPQDRLYLISAGEFEDILPDNLICRAVNSHYGLTGNIKKEEININSRKTFSLENVWKQKGFGEFKKAEFAQIIAENIKISDDLSEEMRKIILNIKEMLLL